ncbi:MAG: hypothetical protein INH37_03710 [Myxococcaceae bacterium]|nr:hypothetical protein [Myxococcaceae bacterium]
MDDPDSDRTAQRIRYFFDWYRQRAANIAVLSTLGRGFEPDQHVLIAAGLDSLANFWASLSAPRLNKQSAKFRMGEFLVAHADPVVFQRVSSPDLMERAKKHDPALAAALSRHVNLLSSDSLVRHWRDDPTLDALTLACAAAGLSLPDNFLRDSRYGELLYRKYRNNWVHELDGHPEMGSRAFSDRTNEPHYSNVLRTKAPPIGQVDKRLVMTIEYLQRVYTDVVASFERQCLTSGTIPGA